MVDAYGIGQTMDFMEDPLSPRLPSAKSKKVQPKATKLPAERKVTPPINQQSAEPKAPPPAPAQPAPPVVSPDLGYEAQAAAPLGYEAQTTPPLGYGAEAAAVPGYEAQTNPPLGYGAEASAFPGYEAYGPAETANLSESYTNQEEPLYNDSESGLISSAISHEADHTITSLAMLATFSIIFITLLGILLAFTLGDTNYPTEGSDGKGGSAGAGNTTTDDGSSTTLLSVPPEIVIRMPARTPATAAISPMAPILPMAPPSTASTRRSGLIFCVVGDSLTTPELFNRQLCDYIVYADIVATSPYVSGFAPLHGPSSWEVFKQGAVASTVSAAGVSFSVNGLGQPESTLSAVPTMDIHLAELVRRANLSAMGVLNFPRYTGINANSLVPAYKAMADAVRAERQVEPMTFIGAWLYEPVASQDFAAEVESIPHLKVIILQTHISKLYYAGDICAARPICKKDQTFILPSFEVGQIASSYLQLRGGNFTVMLSSTLGVMVYAGKLGSDRPSAVDQECEYSYMVDSDFTCTSNISTALESYNQAEQYAYATYNDVKRHFFVTYETVQSLQDKMDTYANASTGWALFEAQRDVWKVCSKDDYFRLAAIQQKARRLGKR